MLQRSGIAILLLMVSVGLMPLYAQTERPTAMDGTVVGPEVYEAPGECPDNSVLLQPSDNVQRLVEISPEGSVFCFSTGVFENATIVPRSGDTFIGLEGAVLDGGGETDHAFYIWFNPNPEEPVRNVTIRGLTIQNYISDSTWRDQISPLAAVEAGPGWVIEYNIIQDNTTGISLARMNWGWADGAVIRHNRIINNEYIGIEGNGSNILFEFNELVGNGWALTDEEKYWSGGGAKFTDQPVWADDTFDAETVIDVERDDDDHLTVRYNWVRFNLWNGIWLDVNNRNAIIELNVIEGNYGSGLMDELSNGTTMRQNIVRNNRDGNVIDGIWGGAELLLVNSQNGEVYENEVTVSGSGRGIIMIFETYRGEFPSQNYLVRDNAIRFLNEPGFTVATASAASQNDLVQGVTGGAGEGDFYDSNNRYDGNIYYVQNPNANYWFWGRPLNWAGFRAQGQEPNGECYLIDTNTPCR